MQIIKEIIQSAKIAAPDGRPLYRYPLSGEQQARLRDLLRLRVASGQLLDGTASAFVLWAAEHIRANFGGGPLTWAFVFQGLGLVEDQHFAIALVERGLRQWKRPLRISEAGIRMFLYSLMAEGGMPEALLRQDGLYSRVMKGLLVEIEAEGGDTLSPGDAQRIARRRTAALPQTFQTEDTARLLADLALALAQLRTEVPEDVPVEITDRWLDTHQPGWVENLPLRLSQEAAEALIRPTLRAERGKSAAATGLIAKRLLRRDGTGVWRAVVSLSEAGGLLGAQLPGAEGLRLRLLPQGAVAEIASGIVYAAAPEGPDWILRRLGGSGAKFVALALDLPFGLAAFADGKPLGEAEIVPAMPAPEEAPSLWRAVDPADGTASAELQLLPGAPRTRAPCLWLLAPSGTVPVVGGGLELDGPEPAGSAYLWHVTGQGELRLADQRWRIQTGAEEDAPEAKLVAIGKALPSWRSQSGGSLIHQGEPEIWGSIGDGRLRRLQGQALRIGAARGLWSRIYDWNDKDASLARIRLICVPPTARMLLRETGPGSIRLQIEGLPAGLSVLLHANRTETRAVTEQEPADLALAVQGAPPGLVTLRIANLETGAALELIAPWPARRGMLLSPDGMRTTRDTPLSVDGLMGWRAILPEMVVGHLQLRLVGTEAVSVPVAGEVALAAYKPLVMAMLSQGGPDAQVNLRLVVSGEEGPRLELRRYHEQAIVDNGVLRVRLARDLPVGEMNAFVPALSVGNLKLHAVDLSDPSRVETRELEVTAVVDLRTHLPVDGGPWLIQSRLDGRPQRAVVWAPRPVKPSTREERVANYAASWMRLVEEPNDLGWKNLWLMTRAVGDGGDAAVSDQIQALAKAPAATVALTLRVGADDLAEALSLDTAAPFFWPTIGVAEFRNALIAERERLTEGYALVLEPIEAAQEADRALARRIGAILNLRPELAAHFGLAMMALGLPPFALKGQENDKPIPLRERDPTGCLFWLAQDAVKRFDHLPSGVSGLRLPRRPVQMEFNPDVQPLIDAPLVAAEIAAGISPAPTKAQMLKLINLRVVDPIYFDAALPAALTYAHLSEETAQ